MSFVRLIRRLFADYLPLASVALGSTWGTAGRAQENPPRPRLRQVYQVNDKTPVPATVKKESEKVPVLTSLAPPPTEHSDKPLPINLPAALRLSNARPLDIALASQRVQVAVAQLQRAKLLWLPTIYAGVDYFRHDGQLQDVVGEVFGTSKSTFMVGAGPSAVFALTDALFSPLAARQDLRAREASVQTALNDTMLAAAEAYFNVQQARGELAGALDTARRVEELVKRAEQLAPGLVPPVEAIRARTELSRRRQLVHSSRERWRVNGAELSRVLRLDPSTLVVPEEPPDLQVSLINLNCTLDELIPIGLTNRPELASQQAIVQATLERLRQERLRPLIPSVLLRGTSTNPAGTLSGGYFGGGRNSNLGKFSARSDFDIQVIWELQNLGLGNRARANERRAENELAVLELFRLQDRIAAEIAQAYAQARSAVDRMSEADMGLKYALESAEKNFEGLGKTRRLGGEVILLVIRPQEVLASIQALGQAYSDYYTAVADYDRAQFRLYRALGHPAREIAGDGASCEGDAVLSRITSK